MMKILSTCLLAAAALTRTHAQLPSYLPADGLVAWFPFTGNAVDSTGFGHDGTVYGTTNGKGRFGVPNTAFKFNGTSDYIFIPAGTFAREQSVDITSSLTISAWVKSSNYVMSAQEIIYWRGDATPAHDPHTLYLNGGQVKIRRDIDPGAVVSEVGYPLAGLDTNYHLFTGTFDSATSIMRVYVDGILKTQAYMPGTQTYATASMYNLIGAVDMGTWSFFYGYIDELGIWRRALTSCEVAALYYSVSNIVTLQPKNDTTGIGGTATFSIHVSALAPTYQWQVKTGSSYTNLTNSAPYSGVNTATLTVHPVSAAMTGKLYRCLVSSDSCFNKASDSAKLVVDTSLQASVLVSKPTISVMPNPNNGDFVIKGSTLGNEKLTVEVTDMAGRVLQAEEATPDKGELNKKIHLSAAFSEGTYLLRVKSENINEVYKVVLKR